MATGDIRNNLKKLQKQVSLIRFPDELNFDGLTKGDVSAHLPILYHAFFDFSPRVVENISKMNYSLAGKKDSAFMSVIFKIMREHNPKCNLTLKIGQFMSKGFAERKIILTKEILEFVRTNPKLAANDGKPPSRGKSSVSVAAIVGANDMPDSSMTMQDVNSITAEAESSSQLSELAAFRSSRSQSMGRSIIAAAPQMQSTARNNVISRTGIPSISESEIRDLHSVCQEDGPQSFRSTVVCHARDGKQFHQQSASGIGNMQESDEVLKSNIKALQERLGHLETIAEKHSLLKNELEAVKSENAKLKKDQITMKEEMEIFLGQKQQIDVNNILARLDIIESKLSVFGNEKVDFQTPHSPVCGDNLCSHMQKMRLQNNDSLVDSSQLTEKSLLDVTNDSPATETRQKSMKLLQLVQGTRTLLGLSDMSSLNQSTEKDVENSPPQ